MQLHEKSNRTDNLQLQVHSLTLYLTYDKVGITNFNLTVSSGTKSRVALCHILLVHFLAVMQLHSNNVYYERTLNKLKILLQCNGFI